jgi:hypothetical protein
LQRLTWNRKVEKEGKKAYRTAFRSRRGRPINTASEAGALGLWDGFFRLWFSPLPAQRSDDPREGVKYDTIKALWESRHAGVVADRIRTGMVDFNDVVQTVKNRWKADSLALTDAIDRKRNGELPLLRSRVNDQLEVLKIALQTAIEHGNPDIMAQWVIHAAFIHAKFVGSNKFFANEILRLGQHAQIMASFAQFLIDRIKKSDYDGPLTRLILEVCIYEDLFRVFC